MLIRLPRLNTVDLKGGESVATLSETKGFALLGILGTEWTSQMILFLFEEGR